MVDIVKLNGTMVDIRRRNDWYCKNKQYNGLYGKTNGEVVDVKTSDTIVDNVKTDGTMVDIVKINGAMVDTVKQTVRWLML